MVKSKIERTKTTGFRLSLSTLIFGLAHVYSAMQHDLGFYGNAHITNSLGLPIMTFFCIYAITVHRPMDVSQHFFLFITLYYFWDFLKIFTVYMTYEPQKY